MITLKDIGREAGVSPVTVSNVINGNHSKASVETIRRVNQVIKKYNYVPNATARSLASKKSKIIGVIINNREAQSNCLDDPYNARMVGKIERIVSKRGYYLMIRCACDCDDILPMIRNWNVDGVIFFESNKQQLEFIRKNMKQPIMLLDTYIDELEFSNVGIDDYQGGYIATNYLLEKGHNEIIFAGSNIEKPGYMQERYRGYKDALKSQGIKTREKWQVITDLSYDAGIKIGIEIGKGPNRCSAVFAAADVLALGIIEGIQSTGLNVPEDLSVIGFDNLKESTYTTPKLTTVNQNIAKKAEIAANYLLDSIQKEEVGIINERIGVEIVERDSVRSI